MRYHWFRSRGLFTGSGAVESGCKAVIGQRLKLSGMRWTVAGADAITTLRCQQASRPEDRIWHAPRNQTPAASPAEPAKRSRSPTKLACTRRRRLTADRRELAAVVPHRVRTAAAGPARAGGHGLVTMA